MKPRARRAQVYARMPMVIRMRRIQRLQGEVSDAIVNAMLESGDAMRSFVKAMRELILRDVLRQMLRPIVRSFAEV